MRVLLISYWFPPTNEIGAVRVGKLAKYLHAHGHDIRVLAGPATGNLSLPLEIPAELVLRPAAAAPPPPVRPASVLRRLLQAGRLTAGLQAAFRRQYYALRYIPDKRGGWRRPAAAMGRQLLADWQPDLILASAPPYSGLMAAAGLARASGIPWIAELRDPWADNPYSTEPGWRMQLDRLLERRTLRQAAALVSVSPPVTEDLRRRYGLPIVTILNGYSEEDLPPPPPRAPSGRLSIIYTGVVYAGLRDPSALFAAIALLGRRGAEIEVAFYGPPPDQVVPLAARHGVQDRVTVHAGVPYRQSLERQAAADVLLLLQRNHVTDEGNIPAKFFEYLGARRPILLLGCETGVIANMIRARGAGCVSNDPRAIADQLLVWLGQLPQGIPALPPEVRHGLSRAEQFAAYETFLLEQAAAAKARR